MVLMFTDIEGSVALKTRVGGAAYASMLARHDELFKKIIASCQGARIIQDTGDGFLARFATGSDAVNAALRFQVGLSQIAWEHEPLRVRIGLNLGEVQQIAVGQKTDDQSKVVGLPMDIAARLMGLASGGQILLTRTIFDDARQYVRELPRLNGEARKEIDSQPLRWMAHGQYLFKGSNEPMDVFEVGSEGLSPLRAPTDSEKARRSVALSDEETLGWRPAAGLEVPRRAGWSLVEKLGEGGFGEVWLGKHARTKESRVFKFCFDSDRLRSFKRELTLFRVLRDVLGTRSDISRLFEVQLEASPYFLETEFSEKGDLAEYAGSLGGVANIPFEERLDIVARTADAVAAAHSVSVLHKDIKPSNILMYEAETGHIRPRLSDFGIGVLTDRSKLKGRNITVTGLTEEMLGGNQSSRTGTRMYAPPEMLREGGEFTMQGDVYALGVLLYQLAAGDLAKPLAPGWEHDIADPLLRRDIADCVAGDLSKRLDSAKALADRIRALPQRRALARRSKLLKFGAAASIALVVVAGLAAAWAVQEMNSRERAEQAERAAVAAKEEADTQRARIQKMYDEDLALTNEMVLDFSKRIRPLKGAVAARQWIAAAGTKWADRVAQREDLSNDTRLGLSRAYLEIAMTQAGLRAGGGGESDAAGTSLGKARSLAKQVTDAEPSNVNARLLAARIMLEQSNLHNHRNEKELALSAVLEAAGAFEKLAAEQPKNFETRRLLASVVQKTGDVQVALKRDAEALASFERSLAIRREAMNAEGFDPASDAGQRTQRDLSVALLRVANLKKDKHRNEAVAMQNESIEIARRLDALAAKPGFEPARDDDDDSAQVTRYRRDLAARLVIVGSSRVGFGELDAAAAMLNESMTLLGDLIKGDPADNRLKRDRVLCLRAKGDLARARDDSKQAVLFYTDSMREARPLVAADPAVYEEHLSTATSSAAKALRAAGDTQAATDLVSAEIAWAEAQLAGANASSRPALEKLRDQLKILLDGK